MSMRMAHLLMHSQAVPPEARKAFARAAAAPPELRASACADAARILCQSTDLDCGEVHELVGLSDSNH